jgi:hypothetical protein
MLNTTLLLRLIDGRNVDGMALTVDGMALMMIRSI